MYTCIYIYICVATDHFRKSTAMWLHKYGDWKKEMAPTYPTHSVLGATGPMGPARVLESRKIGFKGSSALW